MIPYNIFTLDNGLRVVHSYDPHSAMVVLNVLYDTGARDECESRTGIAHLFEHLMFGGSVNVPSFDETLEMAGGTNNAATSNDFTIFYDVMPAQNAETAFYLESDRMLGLAFSDKALDVQRNVVVEEFKQMCLNRPYGDLMHKLRPLMYDRHPYKWPVIGIKPEHVSETTQDEIKDWFYSHYAPNNAIISVVGNISLERTQQLAEKWFGAIPRRKVSQRKLQDDPWPKKENRLMFEGNVPATVIAIGFRMDTYGERGFFAADALTDILGAGRSSRYFQRLVLGPDLFAGADASISGSEHSGFVLLHGQLSRTGEENIDKAQELMLNEARALAQPGNLTEYDLERVKNRYESTFAFENMSLLNRAQNLALAIYHGEDINNNVSRYRSLSLEDIADTARRIFVEHAPQIVVETPKH